MNELDIKLNQYYGGKVVRKDLTKSIKEGANVPSYVLEYLLVCIVLQMMQKTSNMV